MDEIGCLLLSDSITSAMKGNREWVEKTMKPALEATDVYLYEAKPGAKGKKPEKVSDDPVLLIKFVVTVTNAEK
jgi:hypothetical protein